MRQKLMVGVALLCALMLVMPAGSEARRKVENPVPKIIYVPHDNRPISDKQTAEVVEKLGYKVIVPPESKLGNRTDLGHPEELWSWLENNAEEADAAVISSDAMLYGSLVGSRKHDYAQEKITARVEQFREFRKAHPNLKLYVFSSVMRTPRNGEASGHEEPAYYRSYGADIFRYTELKDKEEMEGLSLRERKETMFLERLIPKKYLQDWLGRRKKNFAANERMIGLAKDNTFSYMALGRDDNAPYSQTHMESRHLQKKAAGLSNTKFQAMAGIDEIGMLLLSRAVNDIRREVPSVYVRYNWGRGPATIPAYSDEKIGDSVDAAISMAGGMKVTSPENADLVLMVNTNPNGKTYEANGRNNDGRSREGSDYFLGLVSDYLAKGWPVAIADVAYANGSDNALMEQLNKKGMLFKLRAYSGWNTPTNSSGFVIGEGILTKYMTEEAVNDLLLTRYLDDWVYQANVRDTVARQLGWLRGDGVYGNLDGKRSAVSDRAAKIMQYFVDRNLPNVESLREIEVHFPWNRMFEADITHAKELYPMDYFKK